MSTSYQSTFGDKYESTHDTLAQLAATHDPDVTVVAVSGGTDSICAADVFCRLAPDYGITPTHAVHIDTGTGIPQSTLAARTLADLHGLTWVREGYRNEQDSLAARVLNHGWPGRYPGAPWAGGHGLEWANRKDKPMDAVYVRLEGTQVWVSGARAAESNKRAANVPASGIQRDKPRRVWCSPIGAWSDNDKREYIRRHTLPVSQAYLALGFSGECIACAYDERSLLTNVDLLAPERAYAIRTLAMWLYQRARRGDVDIDPKQLCWGWEPNADFDPDDGTETAAQRMVGCDEESCQTRDAPTWVRNLPDEQIVDRNDVLTWWRDGTLPTDRFGES